VKASQERRIALVTGASMGIGKAIAERLAREGFGVAMLARGSADLTAAASALGAQAKAIACDLADADQPAMAVQETLAWGGRLDMVVNSASATRFGTVLTLSDEEWVTAFQVKVFGALRLMRAAWPHLRASGGLIVNIGGVGARTPKDQVAMTAALSASLMALTKVFADRGVADGVRVNAINPGPVLTPRIIGQLDARAKAGGTTRQALQEAMARDNGAMRVGQPEDVADLVAYLASPGAGLLHGSIIDLDGGMTKGL